MSLCLLFAICLLLFIPTLWAIVDVVHRDFGSKATKALWGIFVVFVPPLGGIAYLIRHQVRRITNR